MHSSRVLTPSSTRSHTASGRQAKSRRGGGAASSASPGCAGDAEPEVDAPAAASSESPASLPPALPPAALPGRWLWCAGDGVAGGHMGGRPLGDASADGVPETPYSQVRRFSASDSLRRSGGQCRCSVGRGSGHPRDTVDAARMAMKQHNFSFNA